MSIPRVLFALGALAIASPSLCPGVLLSSEEHYPDIAKVVAERLPQSHVGQARLSDSKAKIALENYLNLLDSDHSYFLESDVESFEEVATDLDDRLRDGHIEFAYQVFKLFTERVEDRLAFAESLLGSEFDYSLHEEFIANRKELPWPQDKAAQDDLWRRKVKNEILSRKVAKQLEAELPEKEKENEDEEGTKEEQQTPEELVLKRHRQFLAVLNGHDAEWVLQAYLNAFAQAYDPHTAYLSPRASEDFDIAMKLSLTGIGAVLTYDDGAAKIVRLIAGGPADAGGQLERGDKIVAVSQGDGEPPTDIMFWPLYKSVRLIRGEVGTPVVLSVIPASDLAGTTISKIRLIRDKIKLEERAAKSEIREITIPGQSPALKLGVLSLPDFYADQAGRKRGDPESKSCSQDVLRLLNEMDEEGVDGILLDLRNNGGGSLQEAVEMTGFFIDRGPIVQVKANRNVQVLNDPDRDTIYKGPMLVLVNRMSASASEILAGALQDYGRALIVGDSKTHGKGSVQSVFPVDGSDKKMGSLKVTTAAFYGIDGQSTQLRGVKPDIVIPSTLDAMEVGEEFLPNVMDWSWVSPARYNRYGSLDDHLQVLRKNSEDRRENNERFALYDELILRLETRLAVEALPLEWEARLALARQDRELEDLRTQIEELLESDAEVAEDTEEAVEDESIAENEEQNKDTLSDLVLNEALNILRDLIERTQPPPPKPEIETAVSTAG